MSRSRVVFPVYAAAEGLSFFGNAAIQIVLPWLVLLRTGDPAAAGIVAGVAGIAQILATFSVGNLVDRFGAKRLAVFADAGSAVSVAALAIVDATFGLDLGWMIGLAIAGALFDIPGMTARQTLMPRVAERAGRSLDSVAGLRQSIFGLSFLAGPALAGLLLAVLAPSQVLWVTAACSAGAALATLAIRVPEIRADGAETGMRGALRTIRRMPVLVKLFLVAGMSSLISAPLLNVMLPTHFAGMGRPDLLGFTMSAFAVGIFAGSALYAVLARSSRRLAWTAALVTSSIGLLLMATLNGFWVVAIGAIVMGIGSGIINPVFGVVISERVPGTQLGRVMALTNTVSLSAGPLGLGVASVVLASGPLSLLAWGIAAVWIVCTVIGALGSGLRDLESPVSSDDEGVLEETADAHH